MPTAAKMSVSVNPPHDDVCTRGSISLLGRPHSKNMEAGRNSSHGTMSQRNAFCLKRTLTAAATLNATKMTKAAIMTWNRHS